MVRPLSWLLTFLARASALGAELNTEPGAVATGCYTQLKRCVVPQIIQFNALSPS